MPTSDAALEGIRFLLASQRGEGGWGYRAGGMPFVEATALAVAALEKAGAPGDGRAAAAVDRALSSLRAGQHEDGGWGVCPIDEESTWATGSAVYALGVARNGAGAGRGGELETALERGLRYLLRDLPPCVAADSQVLPGAKGSSPSLIGWPWSAGECFWVFPTALAILAAVAAGRGDAPRVQQGTAYLVDRACEGGGWNFGNPYMLDKALWPAVVETAVALLALRAAGTTGDPALGSAVAVGLASLRRMLDECQAPLNLAWGLLGLGAYDEQHGAAATRLAAAQAADGGWRGNPYITALATLALGGYSLI